MSEAKTQLCKNCHEPIKELKTLVACLRWIHASGKYGCNAALPCHSMTYAEPQQEVAA